MHVSSGGSQLLPAEQSVALGDAQPAGTWEGLSATANEKLSIFVHKGHAEIPIPVQTSEVSVLISQTQREPFQPQPAQTLPL